jgi:hypothetical protein
MAQMVMEDETLEKIETIEKQEKTKFPEVPVGFVPTPTYGYKIHRRVWQATRNMHAPIAGPSVGAGPVVIPKITKPLPILQGARVLIYKQDPVVQEIGIRRAFLPDPVFAGPKDSRITIQGMPIVNPNVFGDLIETPGTQTFDSVQTFAVVRQTLTMYQRAINTALPWNCPSLQTGPRDSP